MTVQETLVRFESGISTTSLLAAIYAAVVFIPATIYLQLVTGQGSFPIAWFTLLLWVKLAPFSGRRLSSQESVIVYLLSGSQFIPIFLVYNAWFRTSPIVNLFGLANEIPDWYAPAPSTGVFAMRTLFNQAWLIPITLFVVVNILSIVLTQSLGLFVREIFMEVENLPFPMQQIDGRAILAITGEEKRPVHIVAISAVLGFAYALVLYAMPFMLQAWTGQIIQFIPIPWVDLNSIMELIKIRGSMFGIATDIIPYTVGLVLPFNIVVSMFIGSFGIYFVGNWLITAFNLSPISWWVPGMSIQVGLQRSIMYFWATILIGIGLAAGLGPLLRYPRVVAQSLNYIRKPFTGQKRRSDAVSLYRWALIPMILSLAALIAIFAILVPAFFISNLWIIIPMIAVPLIATLVTGRMIGVTGISFLPVGNLQNILYLSSGYKYADVWFASSPMTMTGEGWLSWFKVAQLTNTKATSIIKGYWIVWPISLIIGILYMQLFWNLAPIPSGRYPGAEIYWPISASWTALWIKGREIGLFPPLWIVISFAVGIGIYLFLDVLHLPLSFIGIAAGAGSYTPYGVAYLIGGIAAQIAQKIIGKDAWNNNKYLISGGLAIGESVAISIGVGIALVINSVWVKPI